VGPVKTYTLMFVFALPLFLAFQQENLLAVKLLGLAQ
jgi:hypothetical protein